MIRDILAIPYIYKLFTKVISKNAADYLFDHKPGCRVLDIGCGPGSHAGRFADADYTGIDTSDKYIEEARQKYSSNANLKFMNIDANKFLDSINGGTAGATQTPNEPARNARSAGNEAAQGFDLIIMFGVLHHLSDEDAISCLSSAGKLLNPDGVFRSFDGVYLEDGQSKLEKLILKKDRGKYIRTRAQYDKILEGKFKNHSYEIRRDLLRIPYSHIICTAHNKEQ